MKKVTVNLRPCRELYNLEVGHPISDSRVFMCRVGNKFENIGNTFTII